jgi:hypothetical protein
VSATRAALSADLEKVQAENDALQAERARLRATVADLRRRVRMLTRLLKQYGPAYPNPFPNGVVVEWVPGEGCWMPISKPLLDLRRPVKRGGR